MYMLNWSIINSHIWKLFPSRKRLIRDTQLWLILIWLFAKNAPNLMCISREAKSNKIRNKKVKKKKSVTNIRPVLKPATSGLLSAVFLSVHLSTSLFNKITCSQADIRDSAPLLITFPSRAFPFRLMNMSTAEISILLFALDPPPLGESVTYQVTFYLFALGPVYKIYQWNVRRGVWHLINTGVRWFALTYEVVRKCWIGEQLVWHQASTLTGKGRNHTKAAGERLVRQMLRSVKLIVHRDGLSVDAVMITSSRLHNRQNEQSTIEMFRKCRKLEWTRTSNVYYLCNHGYSPHRWRPVGEAQKRC